jgi:hypothetical protein
MDELTKEINELKLQLVQIRQTFAKDYKYWSDYEKTRYGDHDQLRSKEAELLKAKNLLQAEKNFYIQQAQSIFKGLR